MQEGCLFTIKGRAMNFFFPGQKPKKKRTCHEKRTYAIQSQRRNKSNLYMIRVVRFPKRHAICNAVSYTSQILLLFDNMNSIHCKGYCASELTWDPHAPLIVRQSDCMKNSMPGKGEDSAFQGKASL